MKKIYKYNELTKKQQEEILNKHLEVKKSEYKLFKDLDEDMQYDLAHEEMRMLWQSMTDDEILDMATTEDNFIDYCKWDMFDVTDGFLSCRMCMTFNMDILKKVTDNEKVFELLKELKNKGFSTNIYVRFDTEWYGRDVKSIRTDASYTTYEYYIDRYGEIDNELERLLNDDMKEIFSKIKEDIEDVVEKMEDVDEMVESLKERNDLYDEDGYEVYSIENELERERERFLREVNRDYVYYTDDLKRVIITG